VQEDNKISSTIPPVTFKLMIASSNYCFLWTDEGPHSANPTTVGNSGPALTWFLYHCDYHLRTTAVEEIEDVAVSL